MILKPAIEISRDGINWTLIADDPPIPLAMLEGLYIRPVLIYMTERDDAPVLGFPPQPKRKSK